MARGDGTGPTGAGRMSGRAAGYCAGYGVPGFANPTFGGGFPRGGRFGGGFGGGLGYGRGFGFGRGRGIRRWPVGAAGYDLPYGTPAAPALTRDQEIEQLKDQARYFEGALEEVGKRIQELDSKTE